MPAFLRFSPRVLAAMLAATALFLPVASRAQDVPPYAAAPAQDQQIHGRIESIDGTFNLTVRDDNGYLDAIQLQQGTIINPTGLTLAPGMIVTIMGYPNGSVFNAVEIDTPYNYSGPEPTPVYYGPGWWYPGFGYGYGPSFSLAIFGGGFTCYQQPWVGHWYGSSPPWGNHNGSGYGGNNPARGGYGNGTGYGGNNGGKGGYGGTSGGYGYGTNTGGKGNGGTPVTNTGNGGTSVGKQGNGGTPASNQGNGGTSVGNRGNGGTSVGNTGNGGTSVGKEGNGGTSTGFASGYGYRVTPTEPYGIAPVRQVNVPGGIATYRSPANTGSTGGSPAYRVPSSGYAPNNGAAYRAPSTGYAGNSGAAYRAPSSGAGYRAPAASSYRAPAASSYRAPSGGGGSRASSGGGSHASSGTHR